MDKVAILKVAIMKIISSLLALVLMLSPAFAKAGLIDNDDFTTDDISGLDWLDLSFTKRLSYNDVEASLSNGSLTGWRFATSLEFDVLVENHLGLEPDNYFSRRQYDGFASLIGLLGSTYSKVESVQGVTETSYFAVAFVDSTGFDLGQPRQFGYGHLGGYFRPSSNIAFSRDKDSGVGSHASLLVRDNPDYQNVLVTNPPVNPPSGSAASVSEPSNLMLLSVALIGLLRIKRRSKTA